MGDTPSSPQYDDMKPRMRGTVIIKKHIIVRFNVSHVRKNLRT